MKRGFAWTGTLLLIALSACGSANDGGTISPGSISTGPSRPPSRTGTSSSSSSGFDDPPPPDEPFACPDDYPLSESDLDAEIGWKAGVPAQGSCTDADLATLSKNFSDTSLRTYFDLGKNLSATCAACVISKDSDAQWGPIVGTAENKGETGFINYGACFGAIEGAPCGKAIQYESFCTSLACNECAFTTKEMQECVSRATQAGEMCASFAGKKTSSCPSWTLNVKSCGEIMTAIKTLCGPTP
jgi:hypothetical protein